MWYDHEFYKINQVSLYTGSIIWEELTKKIKKHNSQYIYSTKLYKEEQPVIF